MQDALGGLLDHYYRDAACAAGFDFPIGMPVSLTGFIRRNSLSSQAQALLVLESHFFRSARWHRNWCQSITSSTMT